MNPGQLAEWIVEQTTDALIYADPEGKIVRWNGASTTLFGFTAEEALGSSLDLIIPERLRAAHWAGFDRAMASGTTRLSGKPTLTRALRKDGARLYVQMTFAVVKDDEGSVVGSVAMAREAAPPQAGSS
jgi:PAS domain S-box-containing protein